MPDAGGLSRAGEVVGGIKLRLTVWRHSSRKESVGAISAAILHEKMDKPRDGVRRCKRRVIDARGLIDSSESSE